MITDIYSIEEREVEETDLPGYEERGAIPSSAKIGLGDKGFAVMLTRIERAYGEEKVLRRAEWIFETREQAALEFEGMMEPESRRSLGGRDRQVLFAQ